VDDSGAEDILAGLWNAFHQAGVAFSDRRWGQLVTVMRASAWLDGRNAVETRDVESLIPLLWDRPEQVREIRKVVLHFANPDLQAALALLDKAAEVHKNAMEIAGSGADGNKKVLAGAEANAKLKEIGGQLRALAESSRRNEVIGQVQALAREVQMRLMGV